MLSAACCPLHVVYCTLSAAYCPFQIWIVDVHSRTQTTYPHPLSASWCMRGYVRGTFSFARTISARVRMRTARRQPAPHRPVWPHRRRRAHALVLPRLAIEAHLTHCTHKSTLPQRTGVWPAHPHFHCGALDRCSNVGASQQQARWHRRCGPVPAQMWATGKLRTKSRPNKARPSLSPLA